MCQIISMAAQYFVLKVSQRDKEVKSRQVIQHSLKLMECRSYQQITKYSRVFLNEICNFQDSCVFYLDDKSEELFTLAVQDKDEIKTETSFAQELYFTDEQIIMFPHDLGITGEVYKKMAHKVENSFGILVKKDQAEQEENE